jgi:hypothetical protein
MHRRHRPQPILGHWKQARACRNRRTGLAGGNHRREVGIDIGKGQRHPFGMAQRDPTGGVGLGRQPGLAAFDDGHAAPDRGDIQLVGLFLRPAQPAGFAKDLQGQPMHPPDRDGGCPKPPHRAAIHPEIDHRVVFQHAAGDRRGDVGRQLRDVLPGHETRHMQRVDAAIGKLGADPGLCRIIAPADPRIVRIGGIGMMPVGKFCDDDAHLANVAPRHHRPHVPDQRIAGVAVVDRTDAPGFTGQGGDRFAFFDGHRHRLFAQHIKAGFKKCLGDFIMCRVRRGDGDKVKAVRAALFALQHLAPIAIGPIRRQPQFLPVGPPGVGPMVQRPGGKVEQPVNPCAQAMRRADLTTLAAADQAPSQLRHSLSPF